MHSRFDEFRATPLGQQLEALIDESWRYFEYAALSRAGVPAVAAVVHDLQARFSEVAGSQAIRQFCGAAVAEVMRRHHHEVLRPRGRVPGGLLTYGAVWTPLPRRMSPGDLLAALAGVTGELGILSKAVPSGRRRDRPEGTGFSAVEHLCHLHDLDIVHTERVGRMLTESLPDLPSVDGLAMAAERDYAAREPDVALAGFGRVRASLVRTLGGVSPAQWERLGLRDSVRRVTLLELVEEIHQHDREHVQELHELAAEMCGQRMKEG